MLRIGNMTYVRAWLEPREVSQDGEAKCTTKRGIQYTPWYIVWMNCP